MAALFDLRDRGASYADYILEVMRDPERTLPFTRRGLGPVRQPQIFMEGLRGQGCSDHRRGCREEFAGFFAAAFEAGPGL